MTRSQTASYNYYYWFDDDTSNLQKSTSSSNRWSFNPDVSELTESLHTINFIVCDAEGKQSMPVSRLFMYTKAIQSATKVNFWFDDNIDTISYADIKDGVFDINASSLSDGLHSISFIALTEGGDITTPITRFFIKMPLGGNGITQYQYWINDNTTDIKTTTLIDKPNPLHLIELLPVESYPLRSSQFHFELIDGKPMVYAKNTIHLRFFDVPMRFTDVTKEFVDYKIGKELEDITSIRKDQVFTRPAKNEILWFTTQAERGDRIEFRTDIPCTLQLFAPSNKEVYSANGALSTSYDGINVDESGSFYLAIHDVTSSNDGDITLNYKHIDKYTILSHTAKEMGVLPTIHIMSIEGNGLDNLQYAMLRNGDHTIVSDTIVASNKAEAKASFVFKGNEQLGNYDLVFHFDDGKTIKDIVEDNAVKLANPRFGNINITYDNPRIMDSPYPICINVTNTGNLTYLEIPFIMAYTPIEKILMMDFNNFYINVDSILINNGFKDSYTIESFNGSDETARLVLSCIPFLEAGQCRTYVLGSTAADNERFNIYTWGGTPWNLYAQETWEAIEKYAAQHGDVILPGTTSIDVPENHVAIGYIASPHNFISLDVPNYNSEQNFIRPSMSSQNESYYSINTITRTSRKLLENEASFTRAIKNNYKTSNYSTNTLTESDPAKRFGNVSDLDSQISRQECLIPVPKELLDLINSFSKTLGHFTEQLFFRKSGIMGLVKEQVNQWNPGDPNDIRGYTAPSGSKYVGKGVSDGYYTIEFENDPQIANAAAHTIVIRDTLDSNVLDLNSFEPTGIKIGNVMTRLNKDTQFPITIDLRPSVYVIAQVYLDYSPQTGIAEWKIISLDPMSLDETTDAMQGALPVNVNGNGQGEVLFNIHFRNDLDHGCEITNQAGIIFDHEDIIMTPTWVNVIDTIAPTSEIISCEVNNDREVTLNWTGDDIGSGIWCYDIYAKTESDSLWHLVREGIDGQNATFTMIDDGNYIFCSVAIDMAGNREQKLKDNEFINNGSIIETTEITNPSNPQRTSNILYDMSGKRSKGLRPGIYVKEGRLKVISH